MFAISLVSLFGYHIYLVALNRTTLGNVILTLFINWSQKKNPFNCKTHFLFSFNLPQIEAFRTPIFRIGGPDKNGFNLGRYNNIQEVFGDDRRLWLLPIFTR